MKKRLVSMLLAFCMLLSLVPATVFAAGTNDTVAMQRLYNPNTGEHFYTGSLEERDTLTALGWRYEGIGWYAPRKGGQPIYRLFNPNTGDHHYTGSIVELSSLTPLGWQYEGVAWNSSGDLPQYRLFNPNAVTGMHHYTGSEEERDYLVSLGWRYEGISWYGSNPYAEDEKTPDIDDGEGSEGESGETDNKVTVSFYDGDRLIEALSTEKDTPLGAVPSVEKSSKNNAILVGYFTDPECTVPFYAENPVTKNTKVYAKYEEMGSSEVLNFTSYAQMDQAPTLKFEIQKASGDVAPENAVKLRVMDGSSLVPLKVEPNGDNYIVYAPDGYNKGASYQLELADGWNFAGKPDTIRTASFTIAMEEVENLKMSDDIIFIQDTDTIKYSIGSATYDVLTSKLVTEAGGTFTYDGASQLEAGDILCIYVGKHPDQRTENKDLLDPATYVVVASVSGNSVTFAPLSAEDQQKMYDIADNFPMIVAELPTAETGTINLSALDAEMYKTMMGAEEGTVEKAKEKIAVGDFVTLYVSTASIESEASLYYGEITAYNGQTGEVTYKKTTRQAILDSMDLYADLDVAGSDIISEEEKAELEAVLLEQVEASGFAEDAASMLVDMITKTEEFRGSMVIKDFLIQDSSGAELSQEYAQLQNLGGKFKLSDDIDLTVELITEGEQLHFSGGTQLAIGIDAEFEVELESDDKIAIEVSAVFVQEVSIDPEVDGEIVYKEILFIPIPIGVKVGAAVEIMSFTAMSFDAQIYTVGAEDKSTWEKIKAIAENPTEALDFDGIPKDIVKGLNTIGDVMDKIEELEDKAKQFGEEAAQYAGYMEDAANLWAVVEESGLTTKDDWQAMGEAVGKTSITSDLLDMMNLTSETGLETEYYDSVDDLMARYSEMVQKETDWVTLVEKKIFATEVSYFGLVIGVEANFVVRADLSLAIGSNLEYQIGKRYEFWFKIGLFKPSAGSSSMDLVDEQFAFQFYVMGRLGVKIGVKANLYVALGSGDLASVGITAELGPYIKLWGFFVYEYTKYRPANTTEWVSTERMAGALYMEFGLYFKMGFEASALGDLFEYEYEFLDEEIPLLTAGDSRYHYQFDYAPEEGEMIVVRDVDNNSTNGTTMPLPQELLSLAFVDLDTGLRGYETVHYSDYIFTLSNPAFQYDPKTGIITVNIPDNTRYIECDLVATYKHNKMAFSAYDMSVTIPLVWTNLATVELTEYYNASVRVGNAKDGFDTVWTKRILKNKEFDLPEEEELKNLIGWNEYKYTDGTGYGDQDTTALTIIDNKAYDFDIGLKTYSLTVTDIQNPDGTVGSKTFYAKFGETFDLSSLETTGTNDQTTGVFTKFAGVTPSVDFDLSRTINGTFADALNNGLTAKANYVDNSITATFSFTGLDHEDISMKIRKGDIPSIAQADLIAADAGLAIKDIYPALGNIYASTTFQLVIGEIEGPDATITFEENGGNEVEDIVKVVGSLVGDLPTPTKDGCAFEGWFLDNETFLDPYVPDKMPADGLTVYAKWNANAYIVTFHVNGGDALEEANQTKQVFKGVPYGEMPVPERLGYGFQGWFTADEGGELITEDMLYALDEDQTLYAQWKELVEIPRDIFDFGETEDFTYQKGVECMPEYTFTAEEGATYKEEEFIFNFKRQGSDEYTSGIPINAGTYDVTITRPSDSSYAKFEQTFVGVINTKKAVRPEAVAQISQLNKGLTWIEIALYNSQTVKDGGIDDLNEDATLVFNLIPENGSVYQSQVYEYEPGKATQLVVWDVPMTHFKKYDITVSVYDPNYEDWTSTNPGTLAYNLKSVPNNKWTDKNNYNINWYEEDENTFYISTAAEFAGLAYLVNSGKDSFFGDTIYLCEDINLSAHKWVPIGFGDKYFEGHFNGDNHQITGVYVNETSKDNVGLFGQVRTNWNEEGGMVTVKAAYIQNIVLEDSYIGGKNNVGGIVGNATMIFTGDTSREKTTYNIQVFISNCVNYAEVYASTSNAGGIVGTLTKQNVIVQDCVNFGHVRSNSNAGGIVGEVASGMVIYNANHGTVTGTSNLGGIVGHVKKIETNSRVHNNYNCGLVKSTDSNTSIGAVVGSRTSGDIKWNYYLADTAFGMDNVARDAIGKSSGSESDTTYSCSEITGPDSKTGATAKEYQELTLIEAINKYIDDRRVGETSIRPAHWVADPVTGYPFPANFTSSTLRESM